MTKEESAVVAVVVMTLETADKSVLAAANLSLCLNGYIRLENLAYEFFLSKDLITKSGYTTLDLPVVVVALEYLIRISFELKRKPQENYEYNT